MQPLIFENYDIDERRIHIDTEKATSLIPVQTTQTIQRGLHISIHHSPYCMVGVTDVTSGKINTWDCAAQSSLSPAGTIDLEVLPLKKKRPSKYAGTELAGFFFSDIYRPHPENRLRRLSIPEALINETKVKFSEPLLMNIQFENQHYIFSHDDLGLLSVSSSLDRAISEIQEEFSELWEEYVTCPEEELTEDAKEFRAKLKGLVE